MAELPELLTLQPSVLGLAGIVKTRNLTPMKVTLELPDEWAASFPARETEWAEVVTVMRIEHLMRVAKAKAAFKLKADGAAS